MSKEVNFVGATQLPLDIRGTAFQRRVWQTLCQIPAGTTVTYSEIAKRIGRPKASHAVAAACAANKIGVAIPCHRVVRKDGGSDPPALLHVERFFLAGTRVVFGRF